MKFRKFIAATTRDCLRMMRDALGADAMIVSTRRTPAGVEVVGIRAEDMPMADDAPEFTPGESRPDAAAAEPKPQLWDDIEDESVALSPAARVLATHGDAADGPPPALLADPAGLPRAQWPRVPESNIPHLVRAGGDYADPAHAAAMASADDESAKPVVNLGAQVDKRQPRRVLTNQARANRAAPIVAAARLDERDRADLANRVADRVADLAGKMADPIMDEMRAMRQWLSHQMDAMAWRDSTNSHPARREVWRRLVDCGFSPELARSIATRLPASHAGDQAERWLVEVLVRNLACVDAERGIVEQGGRYAIVGPTGVGKTTTTAKIAAHCVVKYGASALGLISTDQQRIGAVDQLHTFGRLLGVEVYAARGASDLDVLLASMADRRLVLIDTAGLSQRDEQMGQHLRAISAEGVKRLLVVPAGSHAEQAEDIVRGYSADGLAGMIVSKLDEAVRLGGVLDAAIRRRVPLHYMTNGQRVPEDIHAANARLLAHRALRARNAPVFALEADELDWACAAPDYRPGVVPPTEAAEQPPAEA